MLFFYLRHADPIYEPDSLTPLGHRQAEALAKRLYLYGVDKIYCSSSNRAILTATPTCELHKKELTVLDFANESHAWEQLTVTLDNGRKTWLFNDKKSVDILVSNEVRSYGDKWYNHPHFAGQGYDIGFERIRDESDRFFESIGYKHDREKNGYIPVNPTNERVAFFAHQGFGVAFLSALMDIPYPEFCTHFDLGHSSMTVIEFKGESGLIVPKILQLSNDSHLYKEGLATNYGNVIRF